MRINKQRRRMNIHHLFACSFFLSCTFCLFCPFSPSYPFWTSCLSYLSCLCDLFCFSHLYRCVPLYLSSLSSNSCIHPLQKRRTETSCGPWKCVSGYTDLMAHLERFLWSSSEWCFELLLSDLSISADVSEMVTRAKQQSKGTTCSCNSFTTTQMKNYAWGGLLPLLVLLLCQVSWQCSVWSNTMQASALPPQQAGLQLKFVQRM